MHFFSRQFRSHKLLILTCSILFVSIVPVYLFLSSQQPTDTEGNKQIKGIVTSLFLTKNGTQLQLLGQPYTFTGVNEFSAATLYGSNAGCGGQVDNLDALFASLRPNSIVRFWGWQGSVVTNVTTKQPDWSGIDRVLATASRYNQRVIISLGDQAGTCDNGLWKDISWYSGGFMQVYNPNGLTPLSYWDFVQQIVTRYKDSTTIAMWELMNEPESSVCSPGFSGTGCYGHQICSDHQAAGNSLRYFYDTVGGKIKQIDQNHLIESGVIGTGQCGADNWNYQYIHESPAIDVASYHDYNDPDSPMPGDQWNGLQVRLNQMKTIQKPLIIGESGMLAQDNTTNCISFATRRDKIAAKMNAQFLAGVVGYIPWNWSSQNGGVCNYDIPPLDPLMVLLHNFPLQEVAPLFVPSPTVTPIPLSTATPLTPTQAPKPTIIADTTSPLVTILYPLQGSSVPRNATVNISASVTDNVSVAKVFFSVNNVQLCAVTTTSYSCPWKVPVKKGVVYIIQIKAIDTSGNTSIAQVKVTAK